MAIFQVSYPAQHSVPRSFALHFSRTTAATLFLFPVFEKMADRRCAVASPFNKDWSAPDFIPHGISSGAGINRHGSEYAPLNVMRASQNTNKLNAGQLTTNTYTYDNHT
jgi:hypothetical protein